MGKRKALETASYTKQGQNKAKARVLSPMLFLSPSFNPLPGTAGERAACVSGSEGHAHTEKAARRGRQRTPSPDDSDKNTCIDPPVKTILNKRNECGHVSGIVSGSIFPVP